MISINPFSILAETISPIFLQSFVVAMVLLVVVGTLVDIIHKKNVKYFFENAKKAKLSATKNLSTGEKISVTPLAFITRAVVNALKDFPNFNCSLDPKNNKIIYKKYFHIGFAVDTPHGLMVPKIRNVDQMNIKEIGDELKRVSKECRDLKIDKKEFFGGSMTISSLGGIGGTFFTPIINPPEVAILGVGRSFDRLVKIKGQIMSRKILPISL